MAKPFDDDYSDLPMQSNKFLKKTRTTTVEHKAPGMCSREYVTDQHTDKVKYLKMKLRAYST